MARIVREQPREIMNRQSDFPRMQMPLTVTKEALLVEGSDSLFRELINNLLLMSKQLQGLRAALAEQLGVTEPQYRVFFAVAQMQGESGVSVSSVASALHVTGAFVTAEAGKLLHRGLIEKREDATDRRSVLLSLSETGRQTLQEFAARPQVINDELFRDLTREEFRMLSEIVRRLVSNGERALLIGRALASNESDSDFVRRLTQDPVAPDAQRADWKPPAATARPKRSRLAEGA
jgi:DNA-binding MarR family transcriptional regulator